MSRSLAGRIGLALAIGLAGSPADLTAGAQVIPDRLMTVDEWEASCHEMHAYDLQVIWPIEGDLSEPERPESLYAGRSGEAALEDVPIVESDEFLDPALVEGMKGEFSPNAIQQRNALREYHLMNELERERADRMLEQCLAHPPVRVEGDTCPDLGYGPFWMLGQDDGEGGTICTALRVPEPEAAPADMDRAFQNAYLRPIRVAFNGGSPAVRHEIMRIAQDWADQTNALTEPIERPRLPMDPYDLKGALNFDFGYDTPDGFRFHTWSYEDRSYAADIRIGFEDGQGFWSMIGTDATQHWMAPPGAASMNLEGLHGYAPMPKNWRGTVYHEFGHALGLLHEHQHPTSECGNALRLEDDEGYQLALDEADRAVPDADGRRPGVLTQLQHAPNYWSREDAQHNLQQLKRTKNLVLVDFDPQSIMRYEFAAEWYRDDAPAECLPTGQRPTKPSKVDIAMVAAVYQLIMENRVEAHWGQ